MIIQGIAHWAKIVGEPQPGYDKTKREWSLDLELTPEAIKTLKEVGLAKKIKRSKDGSYEYITFKRPEFKRDGSPSKPIRIVDHLKNAWDGKTKIGNGSVLNVSFLVNDVPYNNIVHKKPGILAVQVVKLVPYEGSEREDFDTYENDENVGGESEDWSSEGEE